MSLFVEYVCFIFPVFSVIVDLSLDSTEESLVCLVLCSVPNLVRSCWYSSFLEKQNVKKQQTVQWVTKAYHFTTLNEPSGS